MLSHIQIEFGCKLMLAATAVDSAAHEATASSGPAAEAAVAPATTTAAAADPHQRSRWHRQPEQH